MALSTTQKNAIHTRANAGESGSALAAEFGCSASMISKLKNHYTPEGTTTTSTVAEVTPVAATVAEVAEVAPTRTVVVNSNKFIGESFEVKATTLGELLKEIGESDAVKAIFKGAGNTRTTLEKSTDKLPDTNGQPLYLFFTPVKTNAGS
jgi:transposase